MSIKYKYFNFQLKDTHYMSVKNLEHHKNKNISSLNLCENPEATTMRK
jgi:hypothetical protein